MNSDGEFERHGEPMTRILFGFDIILLLCRSIADFLYASIFQYFPITVLYFSYL